jgi:hypothetical protein
MPGKPKPLSPVERARAAERLATDPGPLVPLASLVGAAGLSVQGLRRWVTSGRSGSYLDAVPDRRHGWLSKPAALARAQRERAARIAAKGGAPC